MKNAMLFFVGLLAGIAAANEPHEKGRLTLTFKESDPVGDFAEMKRRVPSSFDDKDDAGSVIRFGWKLVELYDDETRIRETVPGV